MFPALHPGGDTDFSSIDPDVGGIDATPLVRHSKDESLQASTEITFSPRYPDDDDDDLSSGEQGFLLFTYLFIDLTKVLITREPIAKRFGY